jgi:signal transduction histidine kinase
MPRSDPHDTDTARNARIKSNSALIDERASTDKPSVKTESSRIITDSTLEDERSLNEARLNARDELISVLSHDLKNPLSSVALNASLILQDCPDGTVGDKIKSRVKGIQRRVNDMVRLISSLLDAEFISAGKLPMRPEKTNVVEDVQDVVNEFLTLAEYSSIRLEVHMPDQAIVVTCDPQRIRQVLSNLISNAIKFATKGSTVSVTLVEIDQQLKFSVTNAGMVIPKNRRDAIFERYVKLDANDNPAMGGRGLGLWISRWIVAQHNGKIWTEPTADGNTFTFTLPI